MAIVLEELSTEELQRELKRRDEVNKKAPKLLALKLDLQKQLEAIEQQLAAYDEATLAEAMERVKSGKVTLGRKRGGTAMGAGRAPGKRLPRGAMQDAILEALATGKQSPTDIADHITANSFPTDNKSVSMALNRMKKEGKVEAVGRAQYRKV